MSAPAKFCNFSHGNGVNKLDQDFPSNRLGNRIQQVQHYTGAVGGPSANRKQLNYSMTVRRKWRGCRAEYTKGHAVELDVDGLTKEEKEENVSRATLIWRAINSPAYTVSLIPITASVGCAAAYWQTGEFFANRYITLLVSSFCAVAWVNLSDVYNFDTGEDTNKKKSAVNSSSSRTGIQIVAWLVLLLGFLGLLWVAADTQRWLSVALSGCGITCGLLYQFPKFWLCYMGLGEPLLFAAIGPFSTIVSYLLQSGTRELSISRTIVSSSLLVGFTSSLILFCSHFHQIEDDKAVKKLSFLVERFGTEAGAKVVKVAIMALYSLVLVLGLTESLPFSSVVLCALTLPMGRAVISFVEKNHNDNENILKAKYYCMRLHTAFGVALAAGLVGARMFARKKLPHAIIL